MGLPDVILRPLSPTQSATRRRLLDAAAGLASDGGYDAVTVRSVAARAGVSAPTAYQYFSSKDHLLVDVLADLVSTTTSAITVRPSRGDSSADRAVATLRRVMRRVEQEPNLYIATIRAYISGAPEVVHARGSMESSMRAWIGEALEPLELDDREAIVAILESVVFAGMVGMVTGRNAPADVGPALERAARVLLPTDAGE